MNFFSQTFHSIKASNPIHPSSSSALKVGNLELAKSIIKIKQDFDSGRLTQLTCRKEILSHSNGKNYKKIRLIENSIVEINEKIHIRNKRLTKINQIQNPISPECNADFHQPIDIPKEQAAVRLEKLMLNTKTNKLGEYIGRIMAHAVLDSINNGNLNITGIENKTIQPFANRLILGEISESNTGKDDFYHSLTREKRFVYRKIYHKVKEIISQEPKTDKPIKSRFLKPTLHKAAAGVKYSILDQPEVRNTYLKNRIGSLINKKADLFVEKASAHINSDNSNSSRQQLGYSSAAGFISVLRERAPGVSLRLNLINNGFDTLDALGTAYNNLTAPKLSNAFTSYFGQTEIADITTSIYNAAGEESLNMLIAIFNKYWLDEY
ncbi:hypothetical protein [Vibrio hepatarius]|uniref:hypothetical protein n=1 Tax=Vibrio hepatarius TaxID=171383 RepID=UPI001C086F20|nr:hypothetical protein [Vibrio hepatarius]MBU2896217.1 hypothetical protein [Vibrio hepatarius]